MSIPTLLVTGSSGLFGSEITTHFDTLGWRIVGVGLPGWNITHSLDRIFEEVVENWIHRPDR